MNTRLLSYLFTCLLLIAGLTSYNSGIKKVKISEPVFIVDTTVKVMYIQKIRQYEKVIKEQQKIIKHGKTEHNN